MQEDTPSTSVCHAHPPAGHVVLSKFGQFPSNEQSAWLRVPYPAKGMTRAHYGSPRPRKIILLYQNLWPPCENAKSALRPYANLTKSMCFQQSVVIHPRQGIDQFKVQGQGPDKEDDRHLKTLQNPSIRPKIQKPPAYPCRIVQAVRFG